MKIHFYPLLIMLAMVFVGCDNSSKPGTGNKTDGDKATVEAANYDLAVMDKGKLVLYDMTNKTAVPVEAEKDSVFNMAFTPDRLYYSVKQGEDTYLKYIDVNDANLQPQLAAAWGVPYNLCVGTASYCQEAPLLEYFPERNVIGMHYMQSPNYGYSEYRVFDFGDGKSYSADDWEGDLSGILYDIDNTDPYEGTFACAEDDGALYRRLGDDMIFLSDKLDFEVDTDAFDELPLFHVISVDPTGKFVLFKAATTFGDDDEYHGPQCYASIDGKYQKVLGEYDEGYPGQWLPDGSLVYGSEGIHLLAPSGKDVVLCPGRSFVLRP